MDKIRLNVIARYVATEGVLFYSNYLAPLPPKGESHPKNINIVHFLNKFSILRRRSPFGQG